MSPKVNKFKSDICLKLILFSKSFDYVCNDLLLLFWLDEYIHFYNAKEFNETTKSLMSLHQALCYFKITIW